MGEPTPPTGSPAPTNRNDADTIIPGVPGVPAKGATKNAGASSAADPAQTLPLTIGPADDATRMTMGPGAPKASTAPPVPAPRPALDAEATRVTQPDITQLGHPGNGQMVGMGDDQRTMVASAPPAPAPAAGSSAAKTMAGTVATNEVNTLPFGQSAPGQSAPASRGPASGTFARTSYTQRVGRTKLNQSLTAESQVLDAKLQISRQSVLADLVSARGGDQLPKGVRKLMEEQGTEGRYAINKELAHGGMGAVLDISDHDFRRRAAMKVILSKFASSHDAMERFLAEAQVTAQLEHPNIVPIHDLGVMEDGTLYFTMKMIEGQSLGKVIKLLQQHHGLLKAKDGTLIAPDEESSTAGAHWNEQEKLHTFLKVLDGVGFAHARGVIHRDIKPDNIMIGLHGEVLVVDWGIAKVTGVPERKPTPGMMPTTATTGVISIRTEEAASATMVGSAMGTLYYMPPEQAQGQLDLIDGRADIYALGATLYELLALRRTMRPGMSVPEMLAAIIEGSWIPLDEADPTINPDLVAIVHRAMAREPKGRYRTCEAFAEDIRRYLAGVAVEARKRSSSEIVAMWVAQNRKKLYALALGVIVLIGAVYGTMTIYAKQKKEHAQQLYAEAKADYDKIPKGQGSVEDLTQVAGTLKSAHEFDAMASDIDELNKTVMNDLGAARFHAAELAALQFNRAQSDKLVAEAKVLDASNDADQIAQALIKLKQARDAADSSDIENTIQNDTARLADRHRLDVLQKLGLHKINAAQLLSDAEKVEKGSPAIEELITSIGNELTLTDTDPAIKLDGMKGMYERLQILKNEHAVAVQKALNIKAGKDKALAARNALAAKDFDTALRFADQAIGFAGGEAEVKAANSDVIQAKAEADRIAAEVLRRKQAEVAALPLVDKANDRLREMLRQDAGLLAAAAEVEKLKRTLADQALDQKQPLILARQAVNDARTAKLAAWLEAERLAQQTIVLMQPWVDQTSAPKSYISAEDVLAALYHQRLHEARDQHNADEAQVMSELLKSADRYTHAFAADFANQAVATLHGLQDGALVKARRLRVGADGRIVPAGTVVDVVLERAQSYEAGTWQFTSGDVTITTVLSPERAVDIRLPPSTPHLPGITLRYVPADLHRDSQGRPAGMKPFWLGATEVTYEQYLAFLRDPETFAIVRKGLIEAYANAENDSKTKGLAAMKMVTYMPSTDAGVPLYHVVFAHADGRDPRDVTPVEHAVLSAPVVEIDKDSAIAYCAWLSRISKLHVRLPTRDEHAFAGTGDDPDRIYPWGPIFDGNFCVSCVVKQLEVAPSVLTPTFDIGPFGHYGLAGGVREWLQSSNTQDDPRAGGVYGSQIAGGGWTDDSEHVFRSDYVENCPHDETSPDIGFRILVEAP